MADQSTTPPPAPPPAATPSSSRTPIIALAVALAAALVVIVVLVATRDDGGNGKKSDKGEEALDLGEGEVYLELASSNGPEPFSGEIFGQAVTGSTVAASSTTSTALTTTTQGPATVVRTDSGGSPGLYGGTRDNGRCDPGQVLRFLQRNAGAGRAFVEALNSDPTLQWSGGNRVSMDTLPDYFAELTPVILRFDTRVTNHGLRNGRPTPRQAVLQAGTAVLVDRYGVPRVRCACGNPLIPPQPTSVRPTYVGREWPTFNPTTIVVVQQTTVVIETFVLTDVETGDQFERPPGTDGADDTPVTTTTTTTIPLPPGVTLGTGDVQVTLAWQSDNDFDLHVIDPTGTEINFGNKMSPSGGSLDVDMIPACGDAAPHAENVFWPEQGAPAGAYSVFVSDLSSCGSAPNTFTLQVRVQGEVVINTQGQLGPGASSERFEFSAPGA